MTSGAEHNSEGTNDATREAAAAVADSVVMAELESVFADVVAAIGARGPACWASGRCCNFEKVGHRLYVTALEAAYTLSKLPAERRPTMAQIAKARERGGCPFQQKNLCSVHEIKPLGCRTYFCDKSAQRWQEELTEEMHGRIRAIHDRHGVEYRYGEWRGMLESMIGEGGAGGSDQKCSRSSSDQSLPVDLTVEGSGGALPKSPETPPRSTAT